MTELWYRLADFFNQNVRTLSMWQWWVMLAIPPLVILLYFLKLKRNPLEVPSTYLWRRTIEDLHVNSLWQRLRQNLLLYLQLLLLLLAILSLLRPSWEAETLTEDRFIFLIDTSASMSATDVEPTRLEAAKRQIAELIDSRIASGSAAMIISFSDRAIVEQPFTDNRRLLLRRLEAIQPTDRTSQLDEALRVAAGLANPGRSGTEAIDVAAAEAQPASLVVVSDGRFQTTPNFAMGNLKPVYVPIGADEPRNVGIVAFSSGQSTDKPGQVQVFGRIRNFGDNDVSLTANLYMTTNETRLIDAAQVNLPAGGEGGVEFVLNTEEVGSLRLELDHQDALSIDNRAYTPLNPVRRARVLFVSPGNDAIESVWSTEYASKLAQVDLLAPADLDGETYRKQSESGAYDLIIYDQCQPNEMPRANTYFIGRSPPDERWNAEPDQQLPQIIDVEQSHPLLRYVALGDIKYIVESLVLKPPQGGTTLVDSHLGPLLAVAPREGYEDLVQGFEIVGQNDAGETYANTDWLIRTSFPVFLGNVLTYLGGARTETSAASAQPGQPVTIRTTHPVDEVQVTDPDGKQSTLQRGPQNSFVFGDTSSVGIYSVEEAGTREISQRFAVNLFDQIESDLKPDESIRTTYEDIQGHSVMETRRREAWKILLLAAFLVLMLEWYIYNRRVYL